MKIIGLDISSSCTGFSVIESTDNKINLLQYGKIKSPITAKEYLQTQLSYPHGLVDFAQQRIENILKVVYEYQPDLIVVEETNLGRNRYSQKILEFLHCLFIQQIDLKYKIIYVSSSIWRNVLEIKMSKEDKKNNQKINKGIKIEGQRGKINKKHLSVRWCNQRFGLQFKLCDNDIADSIALAVAGSLPNVIISHGFSENKKDN
jgi:Holliday junction resolvasome RuvABC endonuclease subunit